MGQDAMRLQVASALDVVVHVERFRGLRQVASIGVIEDGAHGLEVSAAVSVRGGTVTLGPSWPGLARRLGIDESLTGGRDAVPTVPESGADG
jgi:pilus assembly protein CpaF